MHMILGFSRNPVKLKTGLETTSYFSTDRPITWDLNSTGISVHSFCWEEKKGIGLQPAQSQYKQLVSLSRTFFENKFKIIYRFIDHLI